MITFVLMAKQIDFDNIELGLNPLMANFEIATTKKIKEVINKFGDPDKIEQLFEKTPYTKVFSVTSGKKQVVDLPIRSKELYVWLIYSVRVAKDYVYIDKKAYMKQMGIKSINTFKEAIKGLSDNLYIYAHADYRDLYWINPHFFFKGSRINKYPNNLKYQKEDK